MRSETLVAALKTFTLASLVGVSPMPEPRNIAEQTCPWLRASKTIVYFKRQFLSAVVKTEGFAPEEGENRAHDITNPLGELDRAATAVPQPYPTDCDQRDCRRALLFGSIALPSLVSPELGERANQLGIIGSAVIGVILFRDRIAAGFRNLKGQWLKFILITVILLFVQSGIIALGKKLFGGFGSSEKQAGVEQALGGSNELLLNVLILALFAPIIEELVFREAFIGWARGKVAITIAAIVSSVAFVVLHASESPEAMLLYVPGTLSLLAVYLIFKKNIAAAMLAHIFNNSLSAIGLLAVSVMG
ncbi:CPBP family intramembrane glutamic endopeptidase [Corynebacterium pseudotuberculosis]|uniref:CPBP family intramembrane glutamic endopeptidase n=1 Tax=Corynebacterium pseudotuberculosis TaxID=1719 RepID=UPI001E4D5691|nr:type II CAAX endopeptidase family protein [Corynebacterium pseudotuberculosis]